MPCAGPTRTLETNSASITRCSDCGSKARAHLRVDDGESGQRVRSLRGVRDPGQRIRAAAARLDRNPTRAGQRRAASCCRPCKLVAFETMCASTLQRHQPFRAGQPSRVESALLSLLFKRGSGVAVPVRLSARIHRAKRLLGERRWRSRKCARTRLCRSEPLLQSVQDLRCSAPGQYRSYLELQRISCIQF